MFYQLSSYVKLKKSNGIISIKFSKQIHLLKNMRTPAGGFLVTNYHDAGRKVSKSNLDRGRKQKRQLHQTAVDAWRG